MALGAVEGATLGFYIFMGIVFLGILASLCFLAWLNFKKNKDKKKEKPNFIMLGILSILVIILVWLVLYFFFDKDSALKSLPFFLAMVLAVGVLNFWNVRNNTAKQTESLIDASWGFVQENLFIRKDLSLAYHDQVSFAGIVENTNPKSTFYSQYFVALLNGMLAKTDVKRKVLVYTNPYNAKNIWYELDPSENKINRVKDSVLPKDIRNITVFNTGESRNENESITELPSQVGI